MANHDEEASLIEASRRGDRVAFEALIARYQKMVHALTFRMSCSEADAADLAQESFLRAWLRLKGFRGEASFSSWIYRIALNTCLTWKSKQAREEHARKQWNEEVLCVPSGADEKRFHLAQEALLKLPVKQRAAIVLTIYDQMSHAEAAAVLGCSETTVSWRVFAARKKLKRWLRALATKDPMSV